MTTLSQPVAPVPPSAAAAPVRLGQVDYINVLPVYMGLDVEGSHCHLVRGVPTDLNDRLRRRAVDCAPVSAIELARAGDGYAMLPGISISSVGPVGSSMLISRRPPQDLDGASIALSTHSAASLAYFRILCARLWRVTPATVDAAPELDAMLAAHDGCVLIGNPAIVATAAARERGDLCVTDLGEAWMTLTGLPCVFAVWALWGDWARARPAAVQTLREDLERGRAWGHDPTNQGALLGRAAAETGLGEWAMRAYFALQDYGLTPDHERGLRRFFDELAALDLAPALGRLRFVS
ncbi:MAG TPA: menaquinone biosynthesis protein [Candidatus Dormibacteraeota bacterium]